MITLVSRWKLRNGCSSQLLQGLRRATKEVEAGESGTLMYAVHLPSPNPLDAANQLAEPRLKDVSEIVFIEIYRDAKAFSCHLKGPAFLKFKRDYLEHFYTTQADPKQPLTETTFLDRQAVFIRPDADD